MDGFGPALDGYYDTDDALARYLQSRADDHAAAARTARAAPDSPSAHEQRRETVREQWLAGVGGLPERPVDPDVERAGAVERDGFTVERLAFESRPDFHVTANCYVPDRDGPHPGVLFLCGHVDDAKTDPMNQRACIELAANGFVVLAVDPVCQGERRQYLDDGDPVFGGSGGVFPHCVAGQRCFYAGGNLARFVTHDNRCALDHLAGRSDVDAGRLGVTGTSGGGLQAQFLGLVDDRLDAMAVACSVTDRRDWLSTGKRVDAEQVVHGAFPSGLDYDDVLAAFAPKPVFVGAAASDQYFPIEGAEDAVERVRRVYGDCFDAADRVRFAVAETTHCSVFELGDPPFAFLCEELAAGDYRPVDDHAVLDAEDLHVTPTGNVVTAYEDERTIDDLVRSFAPDPQRDGDVDPAEVRRAVEATLDADRDGCALRPRFVADNTEDGLDVERVWFRTERDPDAVVAGVLVADPAAAVDAPAVVLYDDGTEALPARSDHLAAVARERGAALAFDPRGVGAVRNREIPIPAWVDDYDGVYGTQFKLAYDALLVQSSLLGMRAFDAARAGEVLRDETSADRVSFVGEATGAYHALYAAALTDDVDDVVLRGLDASVRDLATNDERSFRPALTAVGVIGACDVPRVVAALEARGVDVDWPERP